MKEERLKTQKPESSLSWQTYGHLTDPQVRQAVSVQSELIWLSQSFLRNEGFVQLLPTIISPITDPLNNEVDEASINCYDNRYRLTQSMIFHKQLSLNAYEKIFIVSPNIRLERPFKASTGVHLFEFTQIDLEVRNGSREDIMDLIEHLTVYIACGLKESALNGRIDISSEMSIPTIPFEKVSYRQAEDRFGRGFEVQLSREIKNPVWLTDVPVTKREFYDRLKDGTSVLDDMDLILPQGHGEVLSGGRREHEYDRIIRRIEMKGVSQDSLRWYLDLAREGLIPPSSGCGFGVERLTKYFCGIDDIAQTRLFPKVPGTLCL